MSEDAVMGRDKDNLYKWRQSNQKRYELYFNRETDKDVLEWFEKQKNKRQYLIDLIKEDMEKEAK